MGLMAWGREKLGGGPPGGDLPIPELRFTVLDTELTGLDTRRDDIIAIGALHMQGSRIELGNAFQELVKPTAVLDGRTVVIHGITPSELEARPAIGGVLALWLRGMPFSISWRTGLVHDPDALELPAPSLFDLAEAFEIPVEAAHSAMGDAYVTAQVFQRFLPHLQQAGVGNLSGLRRVGDPRHSLANLTDQQGHTHF